MRRLTYIVGEGEEGRRVDSFLRRELGLSGTLIKRVKHQKNGLLLDGEEIYTSYPVRVGQVLSVAVGDTENGEAVPRPGELDIVYEDEDVVVINKKAGVPTHPGPTNVLETVGNYLTHYINAKGEPYVFRPVNRLDAPTSGLMVAARHAHSHHVLKNLLHTPRFRRGYLAVCMGTPTPSAGVIDLPIGRSEVSYLARAVCPDGKPSRTRYRVVAEGNGLSLVELELETGRTHQIRVHMAAAGHPLAGDFLYGQEDKGLISRTALHSAWLAFTHPVTGKPMFFRAPLPEDMGILFPLFGVSG